MVFFFNKITFSSVDYNANLVHDINHIYKQCMSQKKFMNQ
jgi:hypothetical protein